MAETGRYEYSIGENKFYIRRFNPFYALEIFGDLQQRFVTPFASIIDGKEGASEEENRAKLMDALGKISSSVSGKELRELAETLIDPEHVAIGKPDGSTAKLDPMEAVRSGLTPADLLLLCWAVISYNFAEVVARLASPTGPAGALLKRANLSADSGKTLFQN